MFLSRFKISFGAWSFSVTSVRRFFTQAGENLSQNRGGITQPCSRGQDSSAHPSQPCLHLLLSPPCPKLGICCSGGAPALPREGPKGWEKKNHSDAKHAKNYFTDKQQRMGLAPGAGLVLYCTNILSKGKEWLKYTRLVDPNKITVCFFSIASPTPSSLHLQLLPQHRLSPLQPLESTNLPVQVLFNN